MLTAALVLLGLGLRAYHYGRCPEIWHDEAAMAVNVLDRGFAELLGPLRFHEAGPPLFLWTEHAVSLLLGDGLYALRLLPFLASCAALLLMVPLTRRLLPPLARPWALLLFACSEQLAWHACEAKSYAVDVLAAAVLLYVFCREEVPLRRRLLQAALLAPLLILFSYPACFLYGGLLAAALPAVWVGRRRDLWGAYLGVAFLAGGTFLLVLLGPARAQRDEAIVSCWRDCFADWDRPWSVPVWAVVSTAEVFRYCFKPLGQPLALLAVLGGMILWRAGRRERVILMALPVGLALLAALLHRYPYGGSRVLVYATPGLTVLVAAAVPSVFSWLRPRLPLARPALVALLLLPLLVSLYRIVAPWERPEAASAVAFVEAQRRPEELVYGNDGIHIYHCRRLRDAFVWLDERHQEPGRRAWVLFTDLKPHKDRVREACHALPGDWRVSRAAAFHFTSAVLLTRGR